jgi:hypothetical protein
MPPPSRHSQTIAGVSRRAIAARILGYCGART